MTLTRLGPSSIKSYYAATTQLVGEIGIDRLDQGAGQIALEEGHDSPSGIRDPVIATLVALN